MKTKKKKKFLEFDFHTTIHPHSIYFSTNLIPLLCILSNIEKNFHATVGI